jgi:hypothetical protein
MLSLMVLAAVALVGYALALLLSGSSVYVLELLNFLA